ncbi:sugar-binding transcriptional regulator [Mycetocola reblochoni]|uniref:Transcriptional repressor DeoR n=2 Tax=Mycetocola reblochoni TaxID=331618 RepID=A0A1R4JUM4_9MICO|nr:sugar-binding domain-containing protein [Mycetocola reblochoni]RLP70359.1 sugar-binding transcriptional regulator [Mycetocola reblochoni]SJN35614.1 transcriptional repressor DeoR [Mycetocola reblochoni REB411]
MSDELLSIRAAELYYDEGKTQDEVGAILGVTRWKVGRLLSSARERGFIRIEIVHPRARKLALERRLVDRFGLDGAVVVPLYGAGDGSELRERIGQAAADSLASLRPVPRILGVSWGRTINAVAGALGERWGVGVGVVQINGGVSLNPRSGTAAATAAEIARKGSGPLSLLPSPAILERLETAQSIVADRTVAAVLDRARAANAFLFSAGPADHGSAHVESGYLTTDDIDELVRRGAVGDVLGRYVDAEGMVVDPALDARTVGLELDVLRNARTSIAVISGAEKRAVARAVVTSGICTELITDEGVARWLLEEDADPRGGDLPVAPFSDQPGVV